MIYGQCTFKRMLWSNMLAIPSRVQYYLKLRFQRHQLFSAIPKLHKCTKNHGSHSNTIIYCIASNFCGLKVLNFRVLFLDHENFIPSQNAWLVDEEVNVFGTKNLGRFMKIFIKKIYFQGKTA